jgi:hypothetical protein
MIDDEIQPLVVRPKEARRLLGCSNTRFYEILPELESFKDGKSRLITMASIRARVARKVAEAAEIPPAKWRRPASGGSS